MTEVQKLTMIKILEDLYKEYEFFAKYNGGRDYKRYCALEFAVKELKQDQILDKIRAQLESNLRGVEIALEVLVENDPLRPTMDGAKTTLEDCLELIDKAEMGNI